MISCDGIFPEGCLDLSQQVTHSVKAVRLPIHQVPGRNKDIRGGGRHFLQNPGQPGLPDQKAQVHIRDLDDPHRSRNFWRLEHERLRLDVHGFVGPVARRQHGRNEGKEERLTV